MPIALAAASPDAPDPLGPVAPYQGGAADDRGVGTQATPQLAAVQLNGRELSNGIPIIAQPGGGALVALEYFLSALSLHAEHDDQGYRIDTPIGTARLPAESLSEVQGYVYVDTRSLAKAFASEVRFDPAEYALQVNTPWAAQSTSRAQSAAGTAAAADVSAPFASLSQVRSETDYVRNDLSHNTLVTTDLGGALGPGYWRVRYYDDLAGQRRADTWSWVTGAGDRRYLLGRQIVGLNALLPTFYLTGAQMAATNRPSLVFGPNLGYGELAASRFDAPRTVRGKGPPGGTAELRRNGQVIAQTTIRLDGTYEFPDQPITVASLEVAVYERGRPDTPFRVEQITEQASDQLLPAGVWVQHTGIGTTANPLDSVSSGLNDRSGFYQWRQGLTDSVTAMAALQVVGDQRNELAGAAALLPGLGAWAGFAAHGRYGNAWQVYGEGARGAAFWRANFQRQDAGYIAVDSPQREDDNVEAGWTFAPNLRASLVGRHYRDPGTAPIDFLKPAFSWQPRADLAFSARPDFDGRYTFYGNWVPQPGWRVALTRYNPRTDLEIERRYPNGYGLRAMLTEDSQLGHRASLLADGWRLGGRPIGWTAGVLAGEGRVGFLLDAAGELYPGLSLHAQYLDDPLLRNARPDPGPLLSVALVADFAVTPSGLARGSFRPELFNAGGISGRIAGADGAFDASRARGTGVLVDGRIRGEVDANGRFYLADLAPGVYTLELDAEKLPLEYQPTNRERRVEVKAGAVTRLDFPVTLRLGMAGRVNERAGHPLAGARVTVTDGAGKVLAEATSDAWGYYRIDGLAPASYRVSASAAGKQATRTTTLSDRFLFEQDLIIDATTEHGEPP
ncbi:carboxypeptidase regulatory-like domain-containing protein [Dokdonella soli]